MKSDEIQIIETQIEATNLHLTTIIDPRRGIRVECDQHLEGYGDGPIVTILRGSNAWEVHIRPTADSDAGRIKVTVSAPTHDREAIVSLAGVQAHFHDLFDDEADCWDQD